MLPGHGGEGGRSHEPGGAEGVSAERVLTGGGGPGLSGSSCDSLCSVLFWHNAGLYKNWYFLAEAKPCSVYAALVCAQKEEGKKKTFREASL